MNTKSLLAASIVGLWVSTSGCAPDMDELNEDLANEYEELSAARQEFVSSINGLRTVNGLTTTNGLRTVNGLSTTNGLRTVNGLTTVNGLRTVNGLSTTNGLRTVNGLTTVNGLRSVNGLRTVNGLTVAADGTPVNEQADLPVDCGANGIPGKDCWGYAEGLLNPLTGMLSNDQGIVTASYLVRCALPKTESVNLVDYTGAVIHLKGEVGFAPEWATGDCAATCQEKVSACLMAFTNGYGEHVPFELSAPFTVGQGHSLTYPYQEAAFFGNLFIEPPQAFFCTGKDADGLFGWGSGFGVGETRVCKGYASTDCAYKKTGTCAGYFGFYYAPLSCEYNWDSFSPGAPGTMTKCSETVTEPVPVPVYTETCSGTFLFRKCTKTITGYRDEMKTFDKTFNHPVTTYVKSTSGF